MLNRLVHWLRRTPPVAEAPAPPAPNLEERETLLRYAGVAVKERRFADAQVLLERILERHHDDREVLRLLAFVQSKLGLHQDAADTLQTCLAFYPRDSSTLVDLGCVQGTGGRLREALATFDEAVATAPDNAMAHYHRGCTLLRLGQARQALAPLREAHRLAPRHAGVQSDLGYALFRAGEDRIEAERLLQSALALDRELSDARINLGLLCQETGRFDEASEHYDAVLESDPQAHEARLNRGLLRLMRGEWVGGWEDYEARRSAPSSFPVRPHRWPEWTGEPLEGRTLLIYGEQGLGDEIMFASCIPEILARAERCVIECSPRLDTLFRRSFPRATVYGAAQDDQSPDWPGYAPSIDFQVPAGSLPGLMRRGSGRFPQHSGYLRADSVAIRRWRERLRALGPGLKVGISWRGGLGTARAGVRSIDPAQFDPILDVPGCRFVSLQYGPQAEREAEAFVARHGTPVTHWPEAIADLDEQAALVSALDLVISVCTAVIHVGGALGRPVWVLVPAIPEWRYGLTDTGMPWYPSVRLYRQASIDAWAPVVAAVAAALQTQVRDRTDQSLGP